MADKKISQLTAATTPLAGTEIVPIVQSSSTVRVPVDDLTVKNLRSNATTGIMQVTGPGVGTTRVMTVPNANFTAARTDAGQTFTGPQVIAGTFNGAQADFGFTAGRGLQIATALNGGTNEGTSVLNARGSGGGAMSLQTDGIERARIDENGNTTIGGGALATTATNGFLYVPTCAGTPTGTPTAKSGFAPIVVNTTNNKLYFYSGGSWRDAGP
jgi:hypothetical protein